jgi:hypothetical protein
MQGKVEEVGEWKKLKMKMDERLEKGKGCDR